MGKHSKYGFDMCATTDCQVYKGVDNEAESTNIAVNDTNGMVVRYNGKLASVFYFDSDGGRTEDVKRCLG